MSEVYGVVAAAVVIIVVVVLPRRFSLVPVLFFVSGHPLAVAPRRERPGGARVVLRGRLRPEVGPKGRPQGSALRPELQGGTRAAMLTTAAAASARVDTAKACDVNEIAPLQGGQQFTDRGLRPHLLRERPPRVAASSPLAPTFQVSKSGARERRARRLGQTPLP